MRGYSCVCWIISWLMWIVPVLNYNCGWSMGAHIFNSDPELLVQLSDFVWRFGM